MKAIVYTSNTGSTEHYAKLLGHELGVSVYSTEEAGNKLPAGTEIVVINYISMLSYIILPFTAAIILIFYYGISPMNIAISDFSNYLQHILKSLNRSTLIPFEEEL